MVFSNDAAQRTNFNNFDAGTTFNSLRFTGPNRPSELAFNVSGNPVAVTSAITADANAGTSALDFGLVMSGGATISADAPAALHFTGSITDLASDLVLGGTGLLTFHAPIYGEAGIVSSSGCAWLLTNNVFSGPTLVSAGTLRINADSAFGGPVNVVTVETSGHLQVQGALNLLNSLVLGGELQSFGTNVWSGPISAKGNNATIVAGIGGPLTVATPISGSGN